MKNSLTLVGIFIILCCAAPAKAQKAYDIITFKTRIYGNPATLQLADGYLLASKVTVQSKSGYQVFTPSAAEADAQGDLRFDVATGTGKFKNIKGSWICLKKMNSPDYSSSIKAVYWDGKVQKTVVFKQVK